MVILPEAVAMSVRSFTTEFKSDAVCAGEGEKVIVDLLEGLKSNKLMN